MPPRNLWAPWRLDYLHSLTDENAAEPDAGSGCFLCDACDEKLDDAERAKRLVLHRDEHAVLMLNRYPYTNGHLLVAPHQHVADLSDLDPVSRAAMMEMAELGNRLLRQTIHCQGANVGMNLGRAAGAGVPGHLHLHVVPRWHGDTNFLNVVGEARVIPQALEHTYAQLAEAIVKIV